MANSLSSQDWAKPDHSVRVSRVAQFFSYYAVIAAALSAALSAWVWLICTVLSPSSVLELEVSISLAVAVGIVVGVSVIAHPPRSLLLAFLGTICAVLAYPIAEFVLDAVGGGVFFLIGMLPLLGIASLLDGLLRCRADRRPWGAPAALVPFLALGLMGVFVSPAVDAEVFLGAILTAASRLPIAATCASLVLIYAPERGRASGASSERQ